MADEAQTFRTLRDELLRSQQEAERLRWRIDKLLQAAIIDEGDFVFVPFQAWYDFASGPMKTA